MSETKRSGEPPSRLRDGLGTGERPKLGLRYGGTAHPRPLPHAGGEK